MLKRRKIFVFIATTIMILGIANVVMANSSGARYMNNIYGTMYADISMGKKTYNSKVIDKHLLVTTKTTKKVPCLYVNYTITLTGTGTFVCDGSYNENIKKYNSKIAWGDWETQTITDANKSYTSYGAHEVYGTNTTWTIYTATSI